MAVNIIKPERIVEVGLALLERELTLPALVWRDAAGDFAGAKNDTISIRVPAYATARTRALRSGAARTRDRLGQNKVDVTLNTDVYKDVRITDEELSLDITSFATEVLNPVLSSIARKLEETLVATMTGATYQTTLEWNNTDPYATIIAARTALNNAYVPAGGRVLVVGSALEAQLLMSDRFVRFDSVGPGASTALAEARIGRVAGFDVISSPAIAPSEAFAFHRTAYVMSSRAPAVPAGAPYGASASAGGFAIRVVRVLDPDAIEDILATDAWVGCNVVTDRGTIDSNGRFQPSEFTAGDTNEPAGTADLLVRAVKIVDLT